MTADRDNRDDPRIVEEEPVPLALCTSTPDCSAAVDMHQDDCPVEHALLKEFGF